MFKAIKNLFSHDKQAYLLNSWNDRNITYTPMSPMALAANRSACLELTGKLLCYIAAGDEKGQKATIAYLYRYICEMLPEGGKVSLPAGMSSDPSYIAQTVCTDPGEAIAHLNAFAKSRGLNLYECVLQILGDKDDSAPVEMEKKSA